jgi:nitrite reductase/ring-hydroxylating ferredoxin subunit
VGGFEVQAKSSQPLDSEPLSPISLLVTSRHSYTTQLQYAKSELVKSDNGQPSIHYLYVGRIEEFVDVANLETPNVQNEQEAKLPSQNPLKSAIKCFTLPDTGSSKGKTELNIFKYKGGYYAMNALCPHQNGLLAGGTVGDIEDMGIVWGAAITCPVHEWTFSLETGACDRPSFVLAVYDVKVDEEGKVFVSSTPKNAEAMVALKEKQQQRKIARAEPRQQNVLSTPTQSAGASTEKRKQPENGAGVEPSPLKPKQPVSFKYWPG